MGGATNGEAGTIEGSSRPTKVSSSELSTGTSSNTSDEGSDMADRGPNLKEKISCPKCRN